MNLYSHVMPTMHNAAVQDLNTKFKGGDLGKNSKNSIIERNDSKFGVKKYAFSGNWVSNWVRLSPGTMHWRGLGPLLESFLKSYS